MIRALIIPGMLLIALLSIIIGLFLFLKPASAIEAQRWFYEKINWRMTPISMQKELRNTRGMGFLLVAVALLTLAFIMLGAF